MITKNTVQLCLIETDVLERVVFSYDDYNDDSLLLELFICK